MTTKKDRPKKDALKDPEALLHNQTPSEEDPSSDSSTPRVNAKQKDYKENPLSSEFVEKKKRNVNKDDC